MGGWQLRDVRYSVHLRAAANMLKPCSGKSLVRSLSLFLRKGSGLTQSSFDTFLSSPSVDICMRLMCLLILFICESVVFFPALFSDLRFSFPRAGGIAEQTHIHG